MQGTYDNREGSMRGGQADEATLAAQRSQGLLHDLPVRCKDRTLTSAYATYFALAEAVVIRESVTQPNP